MTPETRKVASKPVKPPELQPPGVPQALSAEPTPVEPTQPVSLLSASLPVEARPQAPGVADACVDGADYGASIYLHAIFVQPTATQRARYDDLRLSFDTSIATKGTRQQLEQLREVCNVPVTGADPGAKLALLTAALRRGMQAHRAVIVSSYQDVLDALASVCATAGLAVFDPDVDSDWRIMLARGTKACRAAVALSTASLFVMFDSDAAAVDVEVLSLFRSDEPPAPLRIWRLVLAGSVEEQPFLSRAAPTRIGTRLLSTRSCIVQETALERKAASPEAGFEAAWEHLLSRGWTSKPAPGLEPWHYFAPGANKKNGVRRETFFKSKKEILDFVAVRLLIFLFLKKNGQLTARARARVAAQGHCYPARGHRHAHVERLRQARRLARR